MANQKLKTMYDEYKLQLDKNKLSAQNELNKANQKANNYMQNYLKSMGIQDSGLGQSAYTNLGTNYANQMVGINQDYSSKLTDFRNTYNQQAKNEAQTLMQGMDNTQLNNYANSLAGDSGLDDSTTNYIKNLANLYKNQNITNEQSAYDETAIKRLESYLGGNITKTDQDKYVDKLMADEKISQSTKDYINEYIDSYGKGWKQDRTNFTENLLGVQGNNVISQSVLDDFSSRIGNAQTEAEYNEAINEFKNISSKMEAFNGIDTSVKPIQIETAKEKDFGKFRDTGKSNKTQSVYANEKIEYAKKGYYEDGTVINFNYGAGKPANYVLYDGKWYKTSAPEDIIYSEKYPYK